MILRLMRLTIGVLASAALAAGSSQAQPSITVDVGQAVDSLAGTAAESDLRGATSVALDSEYLMLAERLKWSYQLDFDSFSTPGDWLLSNQIGGATWRQTLGGREAHRVHLGGLLTVRHNGESWGTSGFRGLSAFANMELHPSSTTAVRAGYQVDRRVFPDFSALDHVQQQAFSSVLVNLPSRTTLVGEVTAGARHYDGTAAGVSPKAIDVPADLGSQASPAGAGGGLGLGAAGQGPGTGALHGLSVPASAGTAQSSMAYQVTLFGRIAQSLATRTAVSVDVSERRTSGDLPPAVIDTPPRFFDDGVYDDPFASDATTVRATLKHLWPTLTQLSGTVAWFDRRYRSTPAYGADGFPLPNGALRRDGVWWAGTSFRFPMLTQHTGAWTVALVAGYDYVRHQSNDAYYRYTSHAVAVGATVSY